jgi:hypothetical protein
MALATVDELRRYVAAAGTAGGGARLDDGLLESLLDASSARVRAELRDRTLDVVPALVHADPADPASPLVDTAPAVEVRVPLTGAPQRIVQVPDLRTLETYAVTGGAAYGPDVVDTPGATPAWSAPTLMRDGPRGRTALWLRFPTAVWGTELAIVGRWGPAGTTEEDELAPSPAVREAVLVWAARAYHNRTARYADTVQDPAGGVSSYFRNLPPDVASTLDGLRVPGV